MRWLAAYALCVAGTSCMVLSLLLAFTRTARDGPLPAGVAVLAPDSDAQTRILQHFWKRAWAADEPVQGTSLLAFGIDVRDLHAAGLLLHVRGLGTFKTAGSMQVRYHGRSITLPQSAYERLSAAKPAQVLAWLQVGTRTVPFAVREGSATLVATQLPQASVMDQDALQAAGLLANVIADALGETHVVREAIMEVRAVSAGVRPAHLLSIARTLAAGNCPYVLRINSQQLSANAELRQAVRFAQKHGALVVAAGQAAGGDSWSPVPFDLGSVSYDGSTTVEQQIARAADLARCRSCAVQTEFDASFARLYDIRRYVSALRRLGYRFVTQGDRS